jgi:hypothetical protein
MPRVRCMLHSCADCGHDVAQLRAAAAMAHCDEGGASLRQPVQEHADCHDCTRRCAALGSV